MRATLFSFGLTLMLWDKPAYAGLSDYVLNHLPLPASVLAGAILLIWLCGLLDKNLSDEWRVKITAFLRTGHLVTIASNKRSHKPWQFAARTISHFLQHLFNSKSKTRFIKISAVVSLSIIAFGFIYYYFNGDDGVRSEIGALEARSFWLALVIPLLATLLIDLLAAFQTLLFIEMIGKCRALWQVFVLAYGNVVLSLGLFSITFPFVLIGILLIDDMQKHRGTLELTMSPVAQSLRAKQVHFAAMFNNFDDPELAGIGEGVVVWSISVVSKDSDNKIAGVGALAVLTSVKVTIEQVFAFLPAAFSEVGKTAPIEVQSVEVKPGFIAPSAQMSLEVSKAFSGLPWRSLYGAAFRETNLFGNRAFQTVAGTLESVSSTGLMVSLANRIQFPEPDSRPLYAVLSCGGNVTRIDVGTQPPAYSRLKACSTWLGVRETSVKSHAALIAFDARTRVTIGPFALSSLSTTIVIYLVGFVLLYAAQIRRWLPYVFGSNVIEISRVPITLSAIVFVLSLCPIVLIIFLLLH